MRIRRPRVTLSGCLFLAAFTAVSCTSTPRDARSGAPDDEVAAVTAMLTGWFDSRDQAAGPDRFEGATSGNGCISTLRGAAYATSEITLEHDLLVSWDRGWDEHHEQVWGATAGGYEFARRSSGPPPVSSAVEE